MSKLNDGMTVMGMARRAFDKFGKIVWQSTVRKDKSMKDKTLSGYSKGVSSPMGADGNTKRTKSA